jgi:outer membrane protein assembly factor BamD
MSFAPLRPRTLFIGVAFALAMPLTACAGDDTPKPRAEVRETPVEQLYQDALGQLDRANWIPCAAAFDEVERQHPYSVWARRAILMSAFCYYQANKYTESIQAADRFITLHPGNKDAPYAYYLKAISNYEQIVDVGRDQRRTEQAMAALGDLIRRFPQTDYARDARLKLDLTKERGEQVASIGRFRAVIEKYQTTSHVPEALHRLVEAYLSLGVIKEARAAAAVLGHNYPGSEWYEDTFAMMQEYGQKDGGQSVAQIRTAPTAGPAPADVTPVAAPAPKTDVPPPPEAGTKPSAPSSESKRDEEDGGWFDWF